MIHFLPSFSEIGAGQGEQLRACLDVLVDLLGDRAGSEEVLQMLAELFLDLQSRVRRPGPVPGSSP